MNSAFEAYMQGPAEPLKELSHPIPVQPQTWGEAFRHKSHPDKAQWHIFYHVKARLEKTDTHVTFTPDDVYVVSFMYILGGWKAMVSTTLADGMYYEVTYNSVRNETYIDAYKKWENVCIRDEEPM